MPYKKQQAAVLRKKMNNSKLKTQNSKLGKGPRPKHVPQRTCVACRTTGAKRGLVRIVRGAEGRVEVDETGKKPGRGAYLCRARDCWETALKRKTLEYALKTPITVEDKAALQAYASG